MRFQPQLDAWERFDASPYSLREPLCGLSSGALVTTGILAAEKGRGERGTLVSVRGDRVTPIGVARSPVQQIHCAGTADGGAWVAYGDEIVELSRDGETIARRPFGTAQPPIQIQFENRISGCPGIPLLIVVRILRGTKRALETVTFQ
jgi:hypothetical protein